MAQKYFVERTEKRSDGSRDRSRSDALPSREEAELLAEIQRTAGKHVETKVLPWGRKVPR